MFTKVRHRVLDIIMNKFSENTFSVCIMNNITEFVHQDLKKSVSFHYLVPENLSRVFPVVSESKPMMSSGALMAVFDEISTYGTSMKDKNLRPGQSVHLCTEVIKPVYAGEVVTVLTNADKLGRTIGFCSMEMLNERGELVARGKHIRFLQMEPGFNYLTHPTILPWTVRAYELLLARKNSTRYSARGRDIFPLPKGFPPIDGVGGVLDVLGLKKLNSVPAFVAVDSDAKGEAGGMFCGEHGRVPGRAVQAFSMRVQPITSNLLGNMHGGAVACAVEHACVLARSESETGNAGQGLGVCDLPCWVSGVEVRYIAAMKGELVITVAEDSHAPPLPLPADKGGPSFSRSFGKVVSAKDGSLCAEYVCTWSALRAATSS